jgi:glycosyltransferase involved in cell wall biosynthesis
MPDAEPTPSGPPSPDARLFCILITYRRDSLLSVTLQALKSQTLAPELVLVVDNGNSAATATLVGNLTDDALRLEYLSPGENTGPAGGMHLGMSHILPRAQPHDWIMRIDDDHAPPYPTLFEETMARANEHVTHEAMTGAVGLRGARMNWRRGRLITPPASGAGSTSVDYLPTGFFPMYRVSAVQSVGTFDPELFYGFEELEYGLRLRQAGHTLHRLDGLVPPRPTTRAQLRLSEPVSWRRYYSLRNSIIIARRYGHAGSALRVSLVRGVFKPLVNLPLAPISAWRHLRAGIRAIRDGWQDRLGRTWDPSSGLSPGAELPPTPDRALQ